MQRFARKPIAGIETPLPYYKWVEKYEDMLMEAWQADCDAAGDELDWEDWTTERWRQYEEAWWNARLP